MAENMKVYSSAQEKLVADALGGYVIGGSGAAPTAPGDVKTYDWLVECKTHKEPGASIFFDANVWHKIKNEAMGMSRKPVLIVDDGSQKENRTWCLCRSANVNLANIIVIDFPVAIRKNVSAKHDKLSEAIKNATKGFIGDIYIGGAFEFEWEGDDVVVMPLTTFKEIFEK